MYYFIANNAKYEGTYKEGERHGHGTMIYPDGSKYEGIFVSINKNTLLTSKRLGNETEIDENQNLLL